MTTFGVYCPPEAPAAAAPPAAPRSAAVGSKCLAKPKSQSFSSPRLVYCGGVRVGSGGNIFTHLTPSVLVCSRPAGGGDRRRGVRGFPFRPGGRKETSTRQEVAELEVAVHDPAVVEEADGAEELEEEALDLGLGEGRAALVDVEEAALVGVGVELG